MTRTARASLAGIAALTVIAAGALASWTAPDTTPGPVQVALPTPEATPAAHPRPRSDAPAAEAPVDRGATPEEIRRLSEEAVARGDDLSEGLDLPPPALPDGPPPPRPEIPERTEAEILDDTIASLDTLERTVERLEADLEEVREAGDDPQAQRLELRLERTRQRLEERRAEVADALGDAPMEDR